MFTFFSITDEYLLIPEDRKKFIWSNCVDISKNINLDATLFAHIRSRGCLPDDAIQDIESATNDTTKTKILLEHLLKRSLGDLRAFIECLGDTRQRHIMPLFGN